MESSQWTKSIFPVFFFFRLSGCYILLFICPLSLFVNFLRQTLRFHCGDGNENVKKEIG